MRKKRFAIFILTMELIILAGFIGLVSYAVYKYLIGQEGSSKMNNIVTSPPNYSLDNTAVGYDPFYISEIDDDLFAYIEGNSYRNDCTVPREDLRYLHMLHVDFDGNTREGEMIVNKYIADDVLEIMHELYDNGYPIEHIELVDKYNSDDELSMEANNSSAFNFRYISYTTTVSKHGLGLAVDINTLYNPYVKTVDGRQNIEPANASDYVDRSKDFPHKIDHDDLAYKLFTEHGFIWGGDWNNSKDYQHFEIPDNICYELYPQ